MEILKEISEICDQYEECDGICPFYNKGHCLVEMPPCTWELDKIKEVLASNEPNNAHKGGN